MGKNIDNSFFNGFLGVYFFSVCVAVAGGCKIYDEIMDLVKKDCPNNNLKEKNSIPSWAKHYTNPLYFYCREMDMGIPKSIAIFFARDIYEKGFYNFILNNHRNKYSQNS